MLYQSLNQTFKTLLLRLIRMRKEVYSIVSVLLVSLIVLWAVSAVVTVRSQATTANGLPAQDSNQFPKVLVTPDSVSGISVGQTFNVTVSVSGLAGDDLYGFDINFTWNTSVLQYVSHDVEVPVETCPGGVLHQPVIEIVNQLNQSAGTYWLAYASALPAEPFNGGGVFFTVTFVLLQASSSCPYSLQHAILVDSSGNTIPLSNVQSSETMPSSLSNFKLTPTEILANEIWLDWWVAITTGCPRGTVLKALHVEGS
jgi:hypothetical protein